MTDRRMAGLTVLSVPNPWRDPERLASRGWTHLDHLLRVLVDGAEFWSGAVCLWIHGAERLGLEPEQNQNQPIRIVGFFYLAELNLEQLGAGLCRGSDETQRVAGGVWNQEEQKPEA